MNRRPRWAVRRRANSCSASTVNSGNRRPDRVQMRCSMTGGSSGGPWLYKYDSARGLGHVNGVMSGRVGTSVLAAYFDTAVGDMFRGVADRV